MKNFILIISGMLLLGLNTSFAQEWCPEGATWIYSGSAFSERRYLKLEYEKDTLIDEIEVKKIKRTISSEDHSFVPTHVSVYPDGFELMYNRNDTIFWYNNTEFVMLYDFNAEVGSKWEVKANPDINHPCEGKPDDDTLTVTEIGYSEIFGQDMLFYETMFSAWSFNGPIIRWVGSSAYPLPMPYIEKEPSCIPPDLFAGWPAYLMCYSDGSIAGNCMLPTGITDEALKPKIMLYPNPTSDIVYIKGEVGTDCTVEIKDVFGRILHTNEIEENSSIDISALTEGIYFLTIESFNKLIEPQTFKITKK